MTISDQCYHSMFSFYKERYKQKAKTIALVYVSVLEISFMFLFGCFYAAFVSRMPNIEGMSSSNAWTLFVMLSVGICFKNWMQYTGKRRMVIRAKMNKSKVKPLNIWFLWVLPWVILGLAYIVFQAV